VPKESIQNLNETLRLDPDHSRASAILAQAYLVLAEPEQAQRQISYHQRRFPDDEAGLFLEAWAKIRSGAKEIPANVAPRLADFLRDESLMQQLFELLTQEGPHVATMAALGEFAETAPSPARIVGRVLGHFRHEEKWQKIRIPENPSNDRAFGLLVTRFAWMKQRQTALRAALKQAKDNNLRDAIGLITPLINDYPEAMLFYARSDFFSRCAVKHYRDKPRDVPGLLDLFCDSADDAERTINAPAQRQMFRRAAMKDLAIIDSWLYHITEAGHAEQWLIARIERNQTRLLYEMPLTKEEHQRITGLIATAHYMMRPEWVCPLLRDWRKKEPKSLRVVQLLAHWEIKGKNFAAASDLAMQGLKVWAEDPTLSRLRQQAIEEGRKLFR
jgi:hypothetical protein